MLIIITKIDYNYYKNSILNNVRDYYKQNHVKQSRKDFDDPSDFIAGVSPVPYAGRVFNEEEMVNSTSALLDFWLTLGENGKSFEEVWKDGDRDYWMTSEEAKSYGMIDEVLIKNKNK